MTRDPWLSLSRLRSLCRCVAVVLDRFHHHGQSSLLVQDGEAIPTMEPLGAAHGATWHPLSEELRELPDTDSEFAADLEAVQRNQPELPDTVWPS